MINWFEKNKIASVIILILIAVEIFFFSSLPGVPGAGGNPWIARAYHFTVFFLFCFFLLVTIKGNKKIKPSYIFAVLLISTIYSFLDEFHQLFVPGRDANIVDILTDTIGIFSSAVIYSFISRKNIKKKT